jgi:hypothetical protein
LDQTLFLENFGVHKMSLDNIKNLLVKSGISDELSEKICESMSNYRQQVMTEAKKEVSDKIKAAKQVIFEEVQAYKLDLANKVQLFCESKDRAIEKQLMQKSAAGEAEAKEKLGKVYAVLEGIDPKSGFNGKLKTELSDAKKTIDRLGKQVKTYSAQARRATAIAESLMEKNKKLIAESKNGKGKVINESRDSLNISVPSKTTGATKQKTKVNKDSSLITEGAAKTTPKTPVKKETDLIDVIASQMDRF